MHVHVFLYLHFYMLEMRILQSLYISGVAPVSQVGQMSDQYPEKGDCSHDGLAKMIAKSNARPATCLHERDLSPFQEKEAEEDVPEAFYEEVKEEGKTTFTHDRSYLKSNSS